MALFSAFLEILQRPTITDVLGELMIFIAPLWIAVIIGVLVGWSWKPKWATLGGENLASSASKHSSPASSSSFPICFGSIPTLSLLKLQLPGCINWNSENVMIESSFSVPSTMNSDCSSSQVQKESSVAVTDDDLKHLSRLVEVKDGGPSWIQMMDRSTPNMSYQAWRRDPETGPPQYRSRTLFEDATAEMVRDFFWDDEFRVKWDDMLIHAETLEECPTTGAMVVHWVRKFPFFCSDREYIIGRRIWKSGCSYYCVTKGIPYPSMPRSKKPRRVDQYYSSWCIRPAESERGDGQLTACEVILFHHEDMGIPWELAKLGVRQGMWGAVKKIEPGLRAYQKERSSGSSLSRCALNAQINTKVSTDYLRTLETDSTTSSNEGDENEILEVDASSKNSMGKNIPKLLVVGGAVLLACSLDRGLLTKAVIFGVARRFANMGRRL